MISVCIATYNGERFIKRQLESIISQLSAEDEIVISDDGSTDRTLDVVKVISSPLIKIYHNTNEHGYTPNFENALNHVTGDYIFLSDQDDIWAPDKVKICMHYLQKYDMVITDAEIVDEEENKLYPSFFELRHPYKTFWGNILKFGYIGCCMCFRRTVLDRALPFPINYKYSTHDNWLTVVAMLYYSSKVIDDKLVLYRRHGNNASNGSTNLHKNLGFRLSYRMYLLLNLVKKVFPKKRG